MKRNIKYLLFTAIAVVAMTMTSCTDDFKSINKSPASIYTVNPVSFLYNIENVCTTGGEWYDSYDCKVRWCQHMTGDGWFDSDSFTFYTGGIGSGVLSDYLEAGSYMSHMKYYIDTNMPEDSAKYANLIQAARVLVIFRGLYATDMHGSLVYSKGWGLRSGQSSDEWENPKYENQKELFTEWNNDLKNAINVFKTSSNQIDFSKYDQVYGGDAKKWIKACNALRLRIALRWLKRDPATAKQIAAEVLSDPSNYFSGNDDSFILYMSEKQGEGHDFHSVGDMDCASKTFMTYLKKYNDPRKRIFFKPTNCTPDNIAKYNAQQTDAKKMLPTTITQWEGGSLSWDELENDIIYRSNSFSLKNSDGSSTNMCAMNTPQTRLWYAGYNDGTGEQWYPLVTYPDFCFMASEFVLDGVKSSRTAQQWYEDGVRSSLKQWSKLIDICKIENVDKITDAEIDAYMAQKNIAWDASMAKEQIYTQFWIESYKNNNEAWANLRRTGIPNYTTTIVQFEKPYVSGQLQQIPRRKKFSYANDAEANAANQNAAIKEMASDPEFGELSDEFGRFWWDTK
jgi:hypothetical protein